MDDRVWFEAARFRPVLPEEAQVNPGRYGAELAYWLCRALAVRGVVTSYPEYEDWGWFVEYVTPEGDEFRLCCGNVDGTDDVWHCFLQPLRRGLFRPRTPDPEHARALMEGLRAVLEDEDDVQNIRWEEP